MNLRQFQIQPNGKIGYTPQTRKEDLLPERYEGELKYFVSPHAYAKKWGIPSAQEVYNLRRQDRVIAKKIVGLWKFDERYPPKLR